MSVFSEKLTELMESQKLSDTKLAEDLNVDRTTVLRWRTGERSPKLPKLKAIAEYFGVSPKIFVDSNLVENSYQPSERIAIPVYGAVKAGPNGTALEEFEGFEYFEDVSNPQDYFVLVVEGNSMMGDGIYSGDHVLVKKTPVIEHSGQIAVVLIDSYEGTLKRVYTTNNSVTLQASNPAYPPRTFVGDEIEQIKVVGVVKELKRKF